MSGKDTPDGLEGLGLSSEQYDDDQLQEVDNRSADYDELREHAKNPKATWSQGSTADSDTGPDTDEDRRA